jgi:hypothetical protein
MRSRSADAREANRVARAHLTAVLDAELEHLGNASKQRRRDLRRGNAVDLVRQRFDQIVRSEKRTA